jgi:hypothetical protein
MSEGQTPQDVDTGSEHSFTEALHQSSPSPFFADAILDLDTAHDLAETPDASRFTRKTVVPPPLTVLQQPILNMPSANEVSEESPQRRLQPENDATPVGLLTVTTLEESTEKHEMTRITNQDNLSGVHSLRRMRLLWASLPRSRPTWPRDWAWALAFCIVVPLALAGPLFLAKPQQDVWTKPPLSTATFWAWWGAAGASALTARWMYGKWTDSDRSSRHVRVAAGLVSFAAWSVVVYLLLAVTIFIRLPKARWATLLPLAYTVRDVYLVRRWKQRRGPSASSSSSTPASPSTSSYASRYAFFQALTAMALDILAQSLRRASFYRALTLILLTQTAVIGLWRAALIGALDDESTWLLILAALGGKWATGTLARLLSLVASGGVVNWFVQQQQQYPDEGDEEEEYGNVELTVGASDTAVPEAYRTVGASVYHSVLKMDDVMDGDDDDVEEFMQEVQQDHSGGEAQAQSLSTVKGLVAAGLSVSFGSVAMCGLLGGLAQFVWSQIRKVNLWQQQEGTSMPTDSLLEKTWNQVLLGARSFVRSHSDLAMSHVAAYYKSYPLAARDVAQLIEEAGGMWMVLMGARSGSMHAWLLDAEAIVCARLSLSHICRCCCYCYFAVEPVLHDDITTHICACVGGTISGLIVLLTGHFAQRQRMTGEFPATDWDVVKNMLLAFILSYTLLFTVMEPLRAAIKAVYVAYAQHPRSLSHAYPLIYHRLTRLSEANLS